MIVNELFVNDQNRFYLTFHHEFERVDIDVAGVAWPEPASPSPSLTDSWRSNTPSPPLSEGGYAPSCVDEGFIDEEFEDIPKKKKVSSFVHCFI